MRTTGTNSQVAHTWANQSQQHMRSGSMYFEGPKIYSYGSHYLAGEIHTQIKDKSGRKTNRRYRSKFALVRNDTYGPSTSKHLCEIRSACRDLIPYFLVDGPRAVSDPKLAVKDLDAQAKIMLKFYLSKSKVTDVDQIDHSLEHLYDTYRNANRLRQLLGLKEKHPKQSDLGNVQAHLWSRLDRYHELNTPEMIEKKRITKEKRELAKQKQAEAKLEENILRFRKGEKVAPYDFRDLKYDLLRIQGDEVVTSRGARVPLREAKSILKDIRWGKMDLAGRSIGSFTLDYAKVSPDFDDTEIKIGCHKFLLSEAEQVLGQARHLRLA